MEVESHGDKLGKAKGRFLSFVGIVRCSTGVFLGVVVLFALGDIVHVTSLLPPFTASATLVFAAPSNPFGHPRSILGGYPVSALVGVSVLAIFGHGTAATVAAVALAVTAMLVVGVLHPPAAALPMLVPPNEPGVGVALGTVVVCAFFLAGLAVLRSTFTRSDRRPVGAVPGCPEVAMGGSRNRSEEVTGEVEGLCLALCEQRAVCKGIKDHQGRGDPDSQSGLGKGV
jgi:CBS-domain-containing membrane protein